MSDGTAPAAAIEILFASAGRMNIVAQEAHVAPDYLLVLEI